MNKPTAVQSKEFWIKCGLKMGTCGWLYHPDNPVMPIYPPIDLNSLLRYAMPKLKAEYRNWESVLYDWVDNITGDYEKDAVSLFWACYKAFGLGVIMVQWG